MDDLDKYINLLEKKVSAMFHEESSGHDIFHLRRVLNLALHIQEHEGGDRFVIGVAAFLHDVHRIMEKQNGKFCPPKDSLPVILQILEDVDLPKDVILKVLHCIEYHDEYGFTKEGRTVTDLETLILQDADNLDAIGAVGLGRTFSYGGAHSLPMWLPDVKLEKNFEGEHRNDPSTLHHIFSKLLELKSNMHTKTAQKMAKERHKFTQEFFDRFIQECKGEI